MNRPEPNMDGFTCFQCGEYIINCECEEKHRQAQQNLSNGLKHHGTSHFKERVLIRQKNIPKEPRQEEYENILKDLFIRKIQNGQRK